MLISLFRAGIGSSFRGHLISRAPFVVLLAAILVVSGCGTSKGGNGKVSGKVTLGGKPVGGSVHFIGSDNKELSSPISGADGSYMIQGLPAGKAKIMIKGMAAAGGAGAPGGAPVAEPPKDPNMKVPSMGVDPPAKYASADTSGLTFDVDGKTQTKDFELTP
jgi:hypothetical protein